MSILFYKRPIHVPKEAGPLCTSNCQKYVKRAGASKDSIPEGLSLENIIDGRTLPVAPLPCSAYGKLIPCLALQS